MGSLGVVGWLVFVFFCLELCGLLSAISSCCVCLLLGGGWFVYMVCIYTLFIQPCWVGLS